ncbi:glycosyl hydrolase [Parapedobacter sp. 2B3]|uniref:glycosyl hydrolase n=1 Tax=Parapedobacter sp. 2B3 TaxID=3342381 RepID=UPI0035B669F4
MKLLRYLLTVGCCVGFVQLLQAQHTPWPETTKTAKPWARWWWMGSAVDEHNVSQLMQIYADAGFGGLEIAPIYGAMDYENSYIPFLSPRWVDMLRHTVAEGDRMDMGVDLTTGTGWPFGGPQVGVDDAATQAIFRVFHLEAGRSVTEKIMPADPKHYLAVLRSLTAYSDAGEALLLTDRVASDGTLNWTAGPGAWELYAVFVGKTGQQVKRAAPGGEGFTLNHFSDTALHHYLARFDTAFGRRPLGVRALYNDSYEVYGADWTDGLYETFLVRRGYDLRLHIREFLSADSTDRIGRIKSDYRQTLAELLLERFTRPWTAWAHQRGAITKNQAHGSPGNLIDLYAAVDIPEVETFGSSFFPIPGLRRDSADIRNVDPDPIMLKFASSAAAITGKPLVSSETFTWLTEHFKTALSQCKPEVEQAFLAGVNHVFYHGITYSPEAVAWPGWLFYASVNFVPNNSWWPHLKGLNQYITRVQSVLQTGKPDSELLLYWPVYDNWDDPMGKLMQFTVHNIDKWLYPTPFYREAARLMDHGYAADFISDDLLSHVSVSGGLIHTSAGNTPYKALVVPTARRMPVATLQKLLELVRQGATVVWQALPEDVPGFGDYTARHRQFNDLREQLQQEKRVVIADDVIGTLQSLGVSGEQLAQHGLRFIRRSARNGTYYFTVNHGADAIDEWVPFQAAANGVALLLDPQSGAFGKVRCSEKGSRYGIRVQLQPGEALVIRFGNDRMRSVPAWQYFGRRVAEIAVDNGWELRFETGGPALPKTVTLDTLSLWTTFADTAYHVFSGIAAYEGSFDLAEIADGMAYVLELGNLFESARVYINGADAGIAWSVPFHLQVGHLLKRGRNTIRIEVANLMANRIRGKDRRGEEWRRYHEINFVSIDYKPFDASKWPVQPSGLAGPVTIVQYKLE